MAADRPRYSLKAHFCITLMWATSAVIFVLVVVGQQVQDDAATASTLNHAGYLSAVSAVKVIPHGHV